MLVERSVVTSRMRPSFTLTTDMLCPPWRVESNAISSPVGLHRGLPTAGPPMLVSGVCSAPSLLAIQTSGAPVRNEMNVIRLPSEENCGELSNNVELIKAW